MRRIGILVVAVMLAVGLVPAASAASVAPATTTALPYLTGGYPLRVLTGNLLPHAVGVPLPLVDTGPHDASGVRMYLVGGVQHNHPVAQAQYGLRLLDSYRLTGDAAYLTLAVAQAQRIISLRVVSNGAWFYPYDYAFALHQDPTKGLMRAPWFSAMAQGEALSLFTRLFEVTGDTAYRSAADLTFRSFLARPSATRPWVVHVDAARNLWLDEFPHYPAAGSDFTLNGHVFASYGLYDYYVLTHDLRARQLWDGALHTVSVIVPTRIRNPGWISNYCVAHGHPSPRYHAVHVGQLLELHAMTGSIVFARLADLLAADYPSPRVSGKAILAAGTRTAYAFGSHGVIRSQVTRRLSAPLGVTFDLRQRIEGRGVYYRITSGTFAGRWILEQPRAAVARQPVGVTNFLLGRRLVVAAGTVTGVAVSASGLASLVRTTATTTTRLAVDARAWVRGVVSVRVTSGPLAGTWVPVARGTLR
ncbi:MAG: D-glucuronyl C5-epimerase family protein [Actinomycetales bacterium]|nr:D-glucuronyl C5-epimerase family protein [Actinomycetales bacterium]